jgi:ABC-2 type transport system permease protein
MPQPPFWSIARKDIRLTFRDRTALVFIFGLPLLFALMFTAIYGGSKDSKRSPLKMLAVSQDQGPQGAQVLDALRQIGLNVETEASADKVKARVKSGDRPIGLIIAPDFSAKLTAAIKQTVAGDKEPSQVHIEVVEDPAQTQIASMVQGAIYAGIQRATAPLYRAALLARVPDAYRAFAEQSLGTSNPKPAVALDMHELSDPRSDAPEPTAGDRWLPGLAIYFIFFLANGVAVTLINERQEGTLRRMLSAPIGRGQILLGKMVARTYLGLLQVGMMMAVGAAAAHFTLSNNPLGQLLVVLASIFTSTGLGLLIASMGRTQEQIQGMTTLLLVMMGILSGCLFPKALFPEALQKLSVLTPHAWALNAYQDILLRRLPLTATLPNLGVLLLFGAVFYGLALARFRYE